MPSIYETSLNDLEKMQPLFNGYEESVFFSIPSLKSTPLDLRSLGKFDNRNALIPHVRCGDYSKKQTIETAHLAKEMRFKKVFLISGDPPYAHQKGLTSCQAIPYYHRLGLEVGSSLDIYAPCLKTEIKKAEEKIKAGSRYLVTQVVLMSDETEKRLLEIHDALHHTKIKIYPCLSLLKDFRKDSLLLKKICPFVPQEILSRKQDIQDNNKKAVEFFQRLFNSDTMYLFQFRKP